MANEVKKVKGHRVYQDTDGSYYSSSSYNKYAFQSDDVETIEKEILEAYEHGYIGDIMDAHNCKEHEEPGSYFCLVCGASTETFEDKFGPCELGTCNCC